MSNYTSVTIGGGKTVVSHDGSSQNALQGVKRIADEGKMKDLANYSPPEHARKQSVYITGNEMRYDEGGPHTSTYTGLKGSLPGSLSTVTTPDGRPINSMKEVQPNSLISYGGTELEIKTAMHLGIVTQDGNGNYCVVGEEGLKAGSPSPQEAEKQRNTTKEVIDFTGPKYHEVFNTIAERSGKKALDAVIVQALDSTVTGRDMASTLADFSVDNGFNPESVKVVLEKYANSLLENGLGYIAKRHGVDAEDLLQYVETKTSKQYQSSLLRGLHYNVLGDGEELVRYFKINERIG